MLTESLIVSHECWGEEEQKLRRLVLKGPIAKKAKAGQFVAVQVRDALLPSFDPLLRRPISLAEIRPERDEITLVYRIQGRGTEILTKARCGERLSVIGPLGQGFTLAEKGELWLAAGGLGVFPLYALAQSALAQGLVVRLFWGGDKRQFIQSAGFAEWEELGIPIQITTLDGSLGETGLVTEPLQRSLSQLSEDAEKGKSFPGQVSRPVQIAACGPRKMLQAVTELAVKYAVPVQVSLEERMGCAVGACLGCVCPFIDETGSVSHKKVCLDGPVFRGEEVAWDAFG